MVLSILSRYMRGSANLDDETKGSFAASTEDGRGISKKRLQAVESQMRLVFAAVLGRLDESQAITSPAQATYNKSKTTITTAPAQLSSIPALDDKSCNQKPINPPCCAIECSPRGEANSTRTSLVWTAEEVDQWLQARPTTDGVALWLSGKANLKGLAEVCLARDVDGVGLLALLRQDELPPIVTGPLRTLPSMPCKTPTNKAAVAVKAEEADLRSSSNCSDNAVEALQQRQRC